MEQDIDLRPGGRTRPVAFYSGVVIVRRNGGKFAARQKRTERKRHGTEKSTKRSQSLCE